MNIVVKKTNEINTSKGVVDNFLASILNDSQNSFNMVEEDFQMESRYLNTSSRPKIPMTNLTKILSNMSNMNLSAAYSPIVVETSILIGEVSIKEEINPLEQADKKLAFTSTKNLIIGIILLFWFVIPSSCVGPIIMSLPAKHPLIKAWWRTQSNLIWTLPLTFMLYIINRKQISFKRDHSPRILINNMITAFLGFLWFIGLVYSCSMTITSHAMVMYSSAGVYMFAYALITRANIHKFEYFGHFIFFAGIFLLLTDPYAIKEGGTGNQYVGDLIAFISAFAGALQSKFNSKSWKLVHPIVLLTHSWIFNMIFQLIMASCIIGPKLVFSFDQEYGAFGWATSSELIVYMLVAVAPIFGVANNLWFYISYYFWPMEIIAGAILTQPFFSQIAGVLMGQDRIPGFRTILGLGIITVATFATSYGARLKAIEEVEKIWKDELITSKIELK